MRCQFLRINRFENLIGCGISRTRAINQRILVYHQTQTFANKNVYMIWHQVIQHTKLLAITRRIGDACFRKPSLSEQTTIAAATGIAVFVRIVATQCEAIIDSEFCADLDNLRFRFINQRCAESQFGLPFHACARRQICHRLIGADVFWAAIWVTAIIDGVDTDENGMGSKHLRPRERVGEEDGVPSRHVGYRDTFLHLRIRAVFRHVDVRSQRGCTESAQIDVNNGVLFDFHRLRDILGACDFDLVALPVSETHGIDIVAFGARDGKGGGGIDAAAE